jgi:hypothetical protein
LVGERNAGDVKRVLGLPLLGERPGVDIKLGWIITLMNKCVHHGLGFEVMYLMLTWRVLQTKSGLG